MFAPSPRALNVGGLAVYCCLAAMPPVVAWQLLAESPPLLVDWRPSRLLLFLFLLLLFVVVALVLVIAFVLAWRPCRMYVSAAMPLVVDLQLLG